MFGLAMLFVFLGGRLIWLQLLDHSSYKQVADENAARIIPILAPRGIIYDRNGKVLLKNRPVFSVYVLQHLLPEEEAERDRIFLRLSSILHLSPEEIKKTIADKKIPAFEGIKIKTEVTPAVFSRLLEENFPGVEVIVTPLRTYPYKTNLAHVLGYVAEIEPEELKDLADQGYRLGDLLGKDGVEKVYDQYLRGISGGKKIEVNAYGRPIRIKEIKEPVPGNNLKLTIDLDLQLAAEEALKGYEGAVVVLDPKTGEILALASHPAYDPNRRWEEISRRNHPFMNRALSGYPPGSVFKVITLSAALEEGKIDLSEVINCPGYYRLGTRIAKCWREWGHGKLQGMEGLVWSCDIVFYELGKRLGPDLIKKFAAAYGLGERSGVDLTQEKRGFIPTAAWKKERFKEDWYEGDSINIGIGQGFISVTPLQMAALYATLGTGKRFAPFVVSQVLDKKGKVIFNNQPRQVGEAPLKPANLALIRQALTDIVLRGTGVAAYVPGLPAAGKTGTAQNPGLPHAWFTSFAPTDDPEIAIAAFVAHGEHGDRASAYVTRDILKWYKEHRLSRKIEEVERPPQYILHGKTKQWYRPLPETKKEEVEEIIIEDEE